MYASLIALALVFGIQSPSHAIHEPTGIASLSTVVRPQTDGTLVVWNDQGDIFGARRARWEAFPIITAPGDQRVQDVDHGILVWSQSPDCDTCQIDLWGLDILSIRHGHQGLLCRPARL